MTRTQMSAPAHRIILDPGHDDAVAIMLALGTPTIKLLGVTIGCNHPWTRPPATHSECY